MFATVRMSWTVPDSVSLAVTVDQIGRRQGIAKTLSLAGLREAMGAVVWKIGPVVWKWYRSTPETETAS
jgi:hypothetical protein